MMAEKPKPKRRRKRKPRPHSYGTRVEDAEQLYMDALESLLISCGMPPQIVAEAFVQDHLWTFSKFMGEFLKRFNSSRIQHERNVTTLDVWERAKKSFAKRQVEEADHTMDYLMEDIERNLNDESLRAEVPGPEAPGGGADAVPPLSSDQEPEPHVPERPSGPDPATDGEPAEDHRDADGDDPGERPTPGAEDSDELEEGKSAPTATKAGRSWIQ